MTDDELKTNPNPNPPPEDDDPKIFNLRTFAVFAGFLVVVIGLVMLSGYLLSGDFLPGRALVATPAPTQAPPQPGVQVNPSGEFQALYATQQAALNTYGWVDEEAGVVRIPVERAMELIAGMDLPQVTVPPGAPTPEAP